MLYWIIYDISENKIRNKIVSVCKNYGFFRVQKSSFIGELTKNKMEMIWIQAKCNYVYQTFKLALRLPFL